MKVPYKCLGCNISVDYLYTFINLGSSLFSSEVNFVFRDIKPENLLLSMDGVLKIADFGLSKHAHVGAYLTTVSVTLWYRPYEILLGCDYNTSADIWSVGMVMCQLFTRLPLIRTKSELKTLRKIFYFLGLPEEHLWPEVCSLERKQFRKNAGNRFELSANYIEKLVFKSIAKLNLTEAIQHSAQVSKYKMLKQTKWK